MGFAGIFVDDPGLVDTGVPAEWRHSSGGNQ
jgi:hypothetical protein